MASSDVRNVPPFPFVVGVARSGTTLLRAILDTHPEMAIPGESHFIPVMVKARRRYESASGFRTERFLHDLGRHPRFRRWDLSEETVRRSFRAEPPSSLAAALRKVYALYAEDRGKQRYGDKTPAYIHHILSVAGLFPEARFVHLVRDGRDVALSKLDHPTMSASSSDLAISWRRGVEKGRRMGRHLGAHRYREVRYEDLVKDPEGVTRLVCDFIELEFHPDMLSYHQRANEIIRPTRHPGSHGRINLPPTRGLRDWKTQMRPADIELFDVLAGELLDELGYERGGVRRGIGSRLAARRRQLSGEIRRAARALRKRVVSPRPPVADRDG
jgi:hypothetical protein